jgi:hypothetical protein
MKSKIVIKSLSVKRDSIVPEGYLIEKKTKNGTEIKLSERAEKEISKRLSKNNRV